MTSTLHDPAAWPITPDARDACAAITARLTDLGWRALGEIYGPEPVAAYADPSALSRLADTAAVPGPHHALLEDAYQSYLAAGDDPDPTAPLLAADPYDASRTTAHP